MRLGTNFPLLQAPRRRSHSPGPGHAAGGDGAGSCRSGDGASGADAGGAVGVPGDAGEVHRGPGGGQGSRCPVLRPPRAVGKRGRRTPARDQGRTNQEKRDITGIGQTPLGPAWVEPHRHGQVDAGPPRNYGACERCGYALSFAGRISMVRRQAAEPGCPAPASVSE